MILITNYLALSISCQSIILNSNDAPVTGQLPQITQKEDLPLGFQQIPIPQPQQQQRKQNLQKTNPPDPKPKLT